MKRVKKFLGVLLALAIVLAIAPCKYAYAMESIGDEFALNASSTIVGPDGEIYTFLGTATRNGAINNPISAYLPVPVSAADGVYIVFYCPNDNKKDLVQGNVTATPVLSGTTQTYSFMNYYNELATINLSNLPGSGQYNITITINAIGSSNKGDVYYRLHQ